MTPKKTLSTWLTTRYLLIIRSEENFAEKKTISFNRARILLLLIGSLLVFMLVSLLLVSTLLKQWFDPRFAEMRANREVLQMSERVDSLIYEVDKKDAFIANIKNILSGKDGEYQENQISQVQVPGQEEVADLPNSREEVHTEIDSQFRKEFEKDGYELLEDRGSLNLDLANMYFFSPIENGYLSSGFDPRGDHFGIDIVSKKDEPVKCVAEGTVIFSSWTMDAGYVVAVQHKDNIISVYKHNSDLLKSVGNFVSAGEIISIIGNTGELTTGPHLHFELWYNGNPIDPADFISI